LKGPFSGQIPNVPPKKKFGGKPPLSGWEAFFPKLMHHLLYKPYLIQRSKTFLKENHSLKLLEREEKLKKINKGPPLFWKV